MAGRSFCSANRTVYLVLLLIVITRNFVMPGCDMCSEELPFGGDFLTCCGCKSQLHYLCANVREHAWRKYTAEQKRNWKCFACKTKTDAIAHSVSSQNTIEKKPISDMESSEIIKLLPDLIRKIIREENTVLSTKIDEFQTSIDFYGKQIDSYTAVLTRMTEENKQLMRKCNHLEQKYLELENQLQRMKSEAEDDRQYSRNINVEVRGLPEMPNENLIDVTLKLAKGVTVEDIKREDIQAVHRVGSKTAKIRPIVVQFTSRAIRDRMLSKSKEKKPTVNLIYEGERANPVYVNEHMTPYYRNLMYEAKRKNWTTANGPISMCGSKTQNYLLGEVKTQMWCGFSLLAIFTLPVNVMMMLLVNFLYCDGVDK